MAWWPLTPPIRLFDWNGSHRLLSSVYSEPAAAFAGIADDAAMLADIIALDGATDDRIQGEQHGLIGISTYELIYGIPNAQIVNAAFTHTSEAGARFSDQTRGAWYASDELETSLAEVTYHKARRLAEMIVPELPGANGPSMKCRPTTTGWLISGRCSMSWNRPRNSPRASRLSRCPNATRPSQQLARQLLAQGSNGVLYPSVRRAGSRCLVCFRPALVYNPRRAVRLEISFTAAAEGYSHQVRSVAR